jgi:hypothetical protein
MTKGGIETSGTKNDQGEKLPVTTEAAPETLDEFSGGKGDDGDEQQPVG